jgi:two-component system, cell cycle sensor histidine kinase and response regulator CckA
VPLNSEGEQVAVRSLEVERRARVEAEAAARREAALADASALLVGSEEDPFPGILEILGRVQQVDRAYLFQLRDDGARMDNTAEWCAPGIEPQIAALQDLSTADYGWWIGELSRGEAIVLAELSGFPPEAEAERAQLESQGVRSVLAVPMIDTRGRLMGFMGFDRVREAAPWSEADLRAIRVVAQMSSREMARRRMVGALRRSQERYRLAGLATRDLLYDWDIRRDVLVLGEGGSSALGITDGLEVDIAWWEAGIHPDDVGTVRTTLQEAMAGPDHDWEARYRFRRGDGTSWADIHERGYFVRDAAGRAVRMVGVMSDRTEQVRMETELRHAQKMQAVGALAGGVAHEFNNLLAVVLGYADLLVHDLALPYHLREAAVEIREAAERGTLLTGQLLAFGRKQVVFPEPIRVRDALERVVRLLRRVLPESIHVADPAVEGDPVVVADPGHFDQVFLNLAVNARDAMPDGGTLAIGAALDGPEVRIAVADTGVGMPDEVRVRAFEPFFTTKPAGDGTGLGLSTVYGIIQALQGRIDVVSEPGRGTIFVFHLPLLDGPEADALRAAAPGPDALRSRPGRGGPLDRAHPPAGPARERPAPWTGGVIVVEDDPGVAGLCRRILTRAGFGVTVVRGTDEALALVNAMSTRERNVLRLLLCDVGLPGGPGTELVDRLRMEFEELGGLPAIFMSGYTATAATLSEEGAVVLPKPFSAETLMEAVAQVLPSA